MKYKLRTLPRNCSKEELIEEIRRVDSLLGKDKITQKDFNKLAKLSAPSISRRFGSWEQAPLIDSMTRMRFVSEVLIVFLSLQSPFWSTTAKVEVDEWASNPIK